MINEAMKNRLLQYANLIWGSHAINRFDPAVKLLIESFTQELAKVKQDLTSMDAVILEELALKLTPQKYTKIRPGYSLLHFFIDRPEVVLTNRDILGLPEADQKKNEKQAQASFSPLFSMQMYKTAIVSKIYDKDLFVVDKIGKTAEQKSLDEELNPLTLWIGVKIGKDIEVLKNFSFYFDLPHLKTVDDLFDLLPYTSVCLNGRKLATQSGHVNVAEEALDKETEIVKQIYDNQFISVVEDLEVKNLKTEKFPPTLLQHIKEEKQNEFLSGLEPCYWFSFEFLPNFSIQDIKQLVVLTNVVPVINKNLTSVRLTQDQLKTPFIVEGAIGEKLLEVMRVKDNFDQLYKSDQNDSSFKSGTFHVESYSDVLHGNNSIEDKLIKLSELLVEQRASFPKMNIAKIESVIHAVTQAENRDKNTVDVINKTVLEEIGRISIIPEKGVSFVDLEFWLTQGELVHKMPKSTVLLASKTSRLYGCEGYLLQRAVGAKQFTAVQDILAVDKFIFTSRDKIISKQDIINFCFAQYRTELLKVDVYLDTSLSCKPKQGYVRVIQVELWAREKAKVLHSRTAIKDLKTRLALRSPSDYVYNIQVRIE